jgi:uncharacterized damage-inducible protein DinB
MNVGDIKFLFEYDRWANAKVFEAVNALTEEQFANVRDTLAHIIGVEWIWFQRCNGMSPRITPEWMENATRESLRAHLTEIEGEWIAFLDELTADDLARMVAFVRLAGEEGTRKLVHILQHVVNHSTYHRGQVATRIRQAGGTPLDTDFFIFTE